MRTNVSTVCHSALVHARNAANSVLLPLTVQDAFLSFHRRYPYAIRGVARYCRKRFSGLFFIPCVSVFFSFRFASFPATRFYYSSAKRLAET